jgi:hypothetical protein
VVVVAMMRVAHLRAALPQHPVRLQVHLPANPPPSLPAVLTTWTTTSLFKQHSQLKTLKACTSYRLFLR